jgi:hypothetical protein
LPRRSLEERLVRALVGAVFTILACVLVFWFCLYVLPDMLTQMFRDALGLPQ